METGSGSPFGLRLLSPAMHVAMPIDYSKFDHIGESDEEVTAPPTRPAVQIASRANRITRPKAREVITKEVQEEQRRMGGRVLVTPPCTWCGLPTGCFCDQCRRPVRTVCDDALGQCVQCCCKNMGCSEGKARQHGALVLKQVENNGSTGILQNRQNVDPAFAALPFDEQAGSGL